MIVNFQNIYRIIFIIFLLVLYNMYFTTFLKIFDKVIGNYDCCLLIFNYVKMMEYNDSIKYWNNLKRKKKDNTLNKILYLINNNFLLYTNKSLFMNDLKPHQHQINLQVQDHDLLFHHPNL